MSDWISIGNRYLNLENVTEVLIDDRLTLARLFFVGGGTVELRDEDARDIQTVLNRTATSADGTHRTIFPMPGA